MKLYRYPGQAEWPLLVQRPIPKMVKMRKAVKTILKEVKKKGDKALISYARYFDNIKLKTLQVSDDEIRKASAALSEELKTAIQQAKANIELFHLAQKEPVTKVETMPGVFCWRRASAIERAGLYIPGGTAPLFSTVLMLAVPASLAGCKEIILCAPPSANGSIHPAVLHTASICGVKKIFKAGGAQAIAAMAYGTESIPAVQKIFGPGNLFVTYAKQQVQQEGVAIDMPAGPSELLVIADETADPSFVAADLLSQAEHGAGSQVMLITTDADLVNKVHAEVKKQLPLLPRNSLASKALKKSRIILLHSISEALALSDMYAPEHLILSVKNAAALAEKINAAGSVFIGNYSPESAGDYASGTNHTLPTNGYATAYSGVSLDSFVKKITFQELTEEGLNNIAATVMTMADAEGLEAHRNAVAVRLKK